MNEVWSIQRAQEWSKAQPWRCGFNYLPSSAVNATAMWQAESFDADAIERELGWAREIGFNCCRVFLQFLVWDADRTGFLARLERFLEIAARNGLAVVPILFDDCAFSGKQPYLGPQDEPSPGIHNSGWTPSPGFARADDLTCWPRLESYVRDVTGHFAADARILLWDVYNEPGNSERGEKSLPLLKAAFAWTRAAKPSQPVTTAIWDSSVPQTNAFLAVSCDVISFHDYNPLHVTQALVSELQTHCRPLICTEWMRRGFDNHFDTHLSFFRARSIGAMFWGLVNGCTQTHLPWGSTPDALPPELWFHDLLHGDGTPYRPAEVELIRRLASGGG